MLLQIKLQQIYAFCLAFNNAKNESQFVLVIKGFNTLDSNFSNMKACETVNEKLEIFMALSHCARKAKILQLRDKKSYRRQFASNITCDLLMLKHCGIVVPTHAKIDSYQTEEKSVVPRQRHLFSFDSARL